MMRECSNVTLRKGRLIRPHFRFLLVLAVAGLISPTTSLYAQEPAAVTPPEGFVALFNGQDLTGWKGLVADPPKRAAMSKEELVAAQEKADASMREHWRVEGGVLTFDGKGENLCTAKDYEDFELLVDWKIEPGGDSGIYLRGSPQVQIWAKPDGSGGLYNNKKHPSKPLIVADRPVGEWNTFRIIMAGEHVTVYLNGVLVVDDVPLENYWEPDKPIYPRGAIELQNHGGPLWFRNIYLRELPRRGDAKQPAEGVLKRGDRVAIVGDSITEQKLYSRFMEDYLLACVPQLDLSIVQLGWGGEQAAGFAARLDNDLLPLKPTVVTTCYGMNDGLYRPYEPKIGQTYAELMRKIVDALMAAKVRVVVGSPGAVDTETFKRPNVPPAVYNDNLGRLRDIARDLARDTGQTFANVHDPMILAMLRAKPLLGAAYDVCGLDGFHPRPNGHIVMAYAFLKALGCDGQIGTITVDMSGQATATDGHKVLSASNGAVEIESTRWPFCFYGDEKAPEATRSILPFVPFNDDLNRFTLVVQNPPTAAATVTWGETSKRFTREQLAAGINLAAEFLDNPFSEPFKSLDEAVARKQAFETKMIKEGITWFRNMRVLLGDDAEALAAMDKLRAEFIERQAKLGAEVRAALTPVRHKIEIKPEP